MLGRSAGFRFAVPLIHTKLIVKITLILFRDGRKALSKIEHAVNAEFWRIFSWHTFIFASQ
jgi:hypothetical protein